MRKLINIVSIPVVEDTHTALREEWHVLLWNGQSWEWSDAMSEQDARAAHDQQVRLTDQPSKLIRLSTMLENPGNDASVMNKPLR